MSGRSRELIFGQLIGQVALLLAIPVLTRLLSIEEFGRYQAAFSIAVIIQPLATLRRELLIPFSGRDAAQRHRLVGLSVAAGCAALIALAAVIAYLVNNQDLVGTLLATALILLSFALVNIENAYLIRLGERRRLAARNLAGGLLSAGLQLTVAVFVPTAIALALALLLGRAVATAITATRGDIASEIPGLGERRSQRSVSAILSAMLATASSQAVVIVSFVTLGALASAQVGVGQRIAGAPASLVGQALTQIALSDAASLIRERRPGLTTQLRSQTVRTAAIAAVATIALMIGGPIFAVPILGHGYEEAGILIAVFAIPLSLTLVALPATSLLIPLGRERLLFLLQAIRLAAIVAAIALSSAISGNVVTTSVVTSIVWTLAYAPLLTAAFLSTAAHDRRAQSPPDPSES